MRPVRRPTIGNASTVVVATALGFSGTTDVEVVLEPGVKSLPSPCMGNVIATVGQVSLAMLSALALAKSRDIEGDGATARRFGEWE